MKLFLTGSTGLLGLNLVVELLNRGHELTLYVRDIDRARSLLQPLIGSDKVNELQFVKGDLGNLVEGSPNLSGFDGVIHAAALFSDYYSKGSDWNSFQRDNIDATLGFFRSAQKAGVRRGVFVSSVGVLKNQSEELLDPNSIQDLYRRSKIIGEKALLSDPVSSSMQITVVRPGWIFGPNDVAPTTTGAMAKEMLDKGSTMMMKADKVAMVDARDVAVLIANAIEMDHGTETVNAVGHHLSSFEALDQIASRFPKAKVVGAPLAMGLFLGSVFEIRAKLFGIKNPMPVEGIKFIAGPLIVDNRKSIEKYGVQYRSFDETAQDIVDYWMSLNRE